MFRKCLRELRAICGSRNVVPKSYILPGSLPNTPKWPVASRGICDVYEGSHNDSKVCVERLRIYSNDGPEKPMHVCHRHHSPSHPFAPDDPHRPSTRRPWCGDTWCIQILCPSWESRSPLANLFRLGWLAENCRNTSVCIRTPTGPVL